MTAVTGVRAHQTMLDVTGNNISNVNTTGFKKDNTIFADLMYQANKYASGSGETRGGVNPAQVGLGVSVAAIETIFTQGSSSYTGNNSDMMIQGNGFFVYTNGNQQLFSRSGACTLDGNGDLVMSGSGYRLQGYKMNETPLNGYQQDSELSTVHIPVGEKIDARATTRVDYQCNLNSESKAFLNYGFADIPFNAVASANGLTSDNAKIPVDGTNYDLGITTDFDETANNNSTGVNYLNFAMANGGSTTTMTFDMTGINAEKGLPMLSLSTFLTTTSAAGVTTATSISKLPPTDEATAAAADGFDGFVGYVNVVTGEVANPTSTANLLASFNEDTDTSHWLPVYRYPGQQPPKYFAAQYDDDSGTMKIRTVSLLDADGNELSSSGAGLYTDTTTTPIANFDHIKVEPSSFTYNVKSNMNYTNFSLSGSPTVPLLDNDGNAIVGSTKVSYNFIAEFDESIERLSSSPSSEGQRTTRLTLWYYGYSNSDLYTLDEGTYTFDGDKFEAIATAITNGTGGGSMHKLEANVAFNPDGTFDYVEWVDTDNMNAPLGYRIVDGNLLTADGGMSGDDAGPNLQIVATTASALSTSTDTLNFMQAQSLDTPGPKETLGVWDAVGSTSQGGYHATKMTIYDDDGGTHTLEVTFKKVTENRWRWEAFLVEKDADGNDVIANVIPQPRNGEIEFDGSGRISNAIAEGALRSNDGENAQVEITIPFSLESGRPNSPIVLNFGGGVGSGGSALQGITQFAAETTTKAVYQDGYTMGYLKNYSVAKDGTVTGAYTNGVSIPLYRVALATFANEQGLEKVGDSMFQQSVNSGNANIAGAESETKGSIMSQYVEMSNVDLTEEFTHLILAQRGFQANARTISVSDQVLEEVVNLKR